MIVQPHAGQAFVKCSCLGKFERYRHLTRGMDESNRIRALDRSQSFGKIGGPFELPTNCRFPALSTNPQLQLNSTVFSKRTRARPLWKSPENGCLCPGIASMAWELKTICPSRSINSGSKPDRWTSATPSENSCACSNLRGIAIRPLRSMYPQVPLNFENMPSETHVPKLTADDQADDMSPRAKPGD